MHRWIKNTHNIQIWIRKLLVYLQCESKNKHIYILCNVFIAASNQGIR